MTVTVTAGASARVRALLARMTLDEKLAQLVGFWVDQGDDLVAPMAGEHVTTTKYEDATKHGLGHLTRVYGTRPVEPVARAEWLWGEQRRLRTETRLGIPAIVHEECLTGLATWKAATFPTPLAWGAAFDPEAVEEMGALIGDSMRSLGIHQGLAPVLDVIRDPRWGRVDECISEDPYVVATIGTAYVQGLQSAGVHATLKHFVGYSGSQAGRNHAPVHAGPRELADVFLPPFEMAVRDGGARSVMNSYAEIDGVPVAATPEYLVDLLRDRWGFDGTVVSDYFSVAFLHTMHAVAADLGEAAGQALRAGIDVELPTGDAYLAPLASAVRDGRIDESIIDIAVQRVLAQKEDLGLFDEDFETPPVAIDLDTPAHREVARRLAEESIVLLTNDGTLPLEGAPGRRIALIGPNAGSSEALMGCYSFANHVLAHHPETPLGFDIPSVLEALQTELPGAAIHAVKGCDVEGEDRSGFGGAAAAAADADVAIVVVGDRAGLFGRGTVGEGNDADDLELPGVQRELVETIIGTGTPVVVVVISGRPYAVGWALDGPGAAAAVVQAFFPGEEGGTAIAGILSGHVAPSGHLPVSLPRLGGRAAVLVPAPDPRRTVGDHEREQHPGAAVRSRADLHDVPALRAARRPGCLHRRIVHGDGPRAQHGRPRGRRSRPALRPRRVRQRHATCRRAGRLPAGSARAGGGGRGDIRRAADQLAFSGRDGRRIIEPGTIELWVGPSCAQRDTEAALEILGDVRVVSPADPRRATAIID